MIIRHELILDVYTTDVELEALADAVRTKYLVLQPGEDNTAISFRLGQVLLRIHPDLERIRPEWPVGGFKPPVPFGTDPKGE